MMRCGDCDWTYRLSGDDEADEQALDEHERETGHTIEDFSPEWTL
jgi:hypothetical protein